MNNKRLITILLSAILIVALLGYTMTNGSSNVVTNAVNDTGAWVGRVFSAPANGASRFFNSVDNLVNTFEENQRLKDKIDQVNELQVRVEELEAENEKMRQELELDKVLSNYEVVHATVISRNPDQWMETLMIDVGSNEGISEGMAVMAGNGLIGRVVQVNPSSSKVLLLTSNHSNEGHVAASVQVEDQETASANGIVSDYNSKTKNYIMTQVDPNVEIEKGDMVISSGLGGVIPSSLLIGQVADTYMDNHGLFQVVEIEPAGEMKDIRFVTVIVAEGVEE